MNKLTVRGDLFVLSDTHVPAPLLLLPQVIRTAALSTQLAHEKFAYFVLLLRDVFLHIQCLLDVESTNLPSL